MAILNIPDQNIILKEVDEIKTFLNNIGIFYEKWNPHSVNDNDDMDTILKKYANQLDPYMQSNGYQVADVININKNTENYPALRDKFLSEHTHTEDEVRYFIDGEGLFWFHTEKEEVFNVLCQAGDLISVPAGIKHWFDAGETDPHVKAIRIFIDPSGWVPHYTHSKIESKYIS